MRLVDGIFFKSDDTVDVHEFLQLGEKRGRERGIRILRKDEVLFYYESNGMAKLTIKAASSHRSRDRTYVR